MSRKTNVGTGAATLPQIPSACLISVSSCAIHAPPVVYQTGTLFPPVWRFENEGGPVGVGFGAPCLHMTYAHRQKNPHSCRGASVR